VTHIYTAEASRNGIWPPPPPARLTQFRSTLIFFCRAAVMRKPQSLMDWWAMSLQWTRWTVALDHADDCYRPLLLVPTSVKCCGGQCFLVLIRKGILEWHRECAIFW